MHMVHNNIVFLFSTTSEEAAWWVGTLQIKAIVLEISATIKKK